MQWHWGNIGSALAGLSTLVIAVAALIRGPAVVRAWTDRLRAQAETARQEAETIRLERQRGLSGWSRHGVDTYAVEPVSNADELAQAVDELGSGNPTAYVVLRTESVNLGGSLRHMIESGWAVARAPRAGELEALEAGLEAKGIAKAAHA
jgi:hypothetical protein